MKIKKHFMRWQWYFTLIVLSPIMTLFFLFSGISFLLGFLSNMFDVSNLPTPKIIRNFILWGLGK